MNDGRSPSRLPFAPIRSLFGGVLVALMLAACRIAAAGEQIEGSWPDLRGDLLELRVNLVDPQGKQRADLSKNRVAATLGGEGLRVVEILPYSGSTASGEIVIAVDLSGSYSAKFAQAREALRRFIHTLPDRYTVSVVAFGDSPRVVCASTSDRGKAAASIDGLSARDSSTRLYDALDSVLTDLLGRENEGKPSRSGLVVVTDGGDDASALGLEALRRKHRASLFPIHALLYENADRSTPPAERRRLKGDLAAFTLGTGGGYVEGDLLSAEQAAEALRRVVLSGFLLRLRADDGFEAAAGPDPTLRIMVTGDSGEESSWERPIAWQVVVGSAGWIKWAIAIGSLLVLAAAALVFFLARRRRRREPEPAPEKPEPGPGLEVRLYEIGKVGNRPDHSVTLRHGVAVVTGTGTGCEVRLLTSDPAIRERHCELEWDGEFVFVRPLDPEAAVLLQGVPITNRRRIRSDDLLGIGGTTFRIRFEGDP